MILVDSNIIIDVIELDPVWETWSSAALESAGQEAPLVINEIVVAETAPRGGSLERFQLSIEAIGISVEPISVEAAYLAGTKFQNYREHRKKHEIRAILADFLIGGHAQNLGATILTRDPRFYRAYFPSVPLITPSKDEND